MRADSNRTVANGVATDTCRGKNRLVGDLGADLTGNGTGNWDDRGHPF